MEFYKLGDHMWEVGTPSMVALFIEDVTQKFLDDVKMSLSNIGIGANTIQTIFFTKLKFGAVLIEEGEYFRPEYWDEPPTHITEVEDKSMGVLFELLKEKRWDGVWYKNIITDDMKSVEVEFDGLANHVVGFTANEDGFGFVSTKEDVEHPLMFFKTICNTKDENETETVLIDAAKPNTTD